MVQTGVRGWAALLLVVATAGLGCDDDEVSGPQVRLDIQNLQPLEAGRYELWIIEGGMPHLAGVVTPGATGEVDKLMGGAFSGDMATFSLVGFALESEAFGAGNTNGEFFLRTPSDEAAGNNGNDEQGVWIGTPGMPPSPDLALPALLTGWIYEGWVVNTSAGGPFPVTTGRFADDQGVNGTGALDGDAQGPFGGTDPGSDFVMDDPSEMLPMGLARPPFTLNDGDWMVVVTLEPTDNDTSGPFSVKPLGAAVASGAATAPTTFSFGFDPLGSIPSGTASLVNGG
jgi:hypothetical protein